jgi:hypothetical protein
MFRNQPARARERGAKEITVGGEGDSEDRENRAVRPEDVVNLTEIGHLLDSSEPGLYETIFTTPRSTA